MALENQCGPIQLAEVMPWNFCVQSVWCPSNSRIHLVWPPPCNNDHQDYETCLVGDSKRNLHFPLESQGGGHIQRIERPSIITLPETNVFAPENGWLEYDRFLLGPGLFSGALAVSFRECIIAALTIFTCEPFWFHLENLKLSCQWDYKNQW